ncbi:MAG: 50S ribosomal protein L21 [Thermodesulfobacteriota bacterium]
MYTVIKTGGKQFKVDKGDVIKIEMIPGNIGELVTFNDVLALGEGEEINIGAPYVDGAEVVGKILRQAKDKKVIVFKKKKRKGYRRKAGHRQLFTEVLIEEIKSQKKVAKKSPEAKGEDIEKDTLKTTAVNNEEKKPEKKVVKKATKAVAEGAPSKETSPSKPSEEKKVKAKKETE